MLTKWHTNQRGWLGLACSTWSCDRSCSSLNSTSLRLAVTESSSSSSSLWAPYTIVKGSERERESTLLINVMLQTRKLLSIKLFKCCTCTPWSSTLIIFLLRFSVRCLFLSFLSSCCWPSESLSQWLPCCSSPKTRPCSWERGTINTLLIHQTFTPTHTLSLPPCISSSLHHTLKLDEL